jgi:hypothetical protein
MFVSKLRVFFIGKQDSSNDWIMRTFPNLWLILAQDRGGDKWESGYRGMFWGGDMSLTSKAWLHQHIIGNNPLADLYPDKAFTGGEKKNPHMAMKEGDSPAFLYFLDNGLNSPEHPGWGGWGGRYVTTERQLARDAIDTYYDEQTGGPIHSPRATVFRWRGDFQRDFAARVSWGVLPPDKANHHPRVVVNGSTGTEPLILQGRAGKKIKLDAAGSMDPDGDRVTFHWTCYPEAGTFEGTVAIDRADQAEVILKIPTAAEGKTVHIILSVRDQRDTPLTAYKRIVLNVH